MKYDITMLKELEHKKWECEKAWDKEISRLQDIVIEEVKKNPVFLLDDHPFSVEPLQTIERGAYNYKIYPKKKNYDISHLDAMVKKNMPKQIKDGNLLIAKMVLILPFLKHPSLTILFDGNVIYDILPKYNDSLSARKIIFRYYPSQKIAEEWYNLNNEQRDELLKEFLHNLGFCMRYDKSNTRIKFEKISNK